jgi:hypothetical protein
VTEVGRSAARPNVDASRFRVAPRAWKVSSTWTCGSRSLTCTAYRSGRDCASSNGETVGAQAQRQISTHSEADRCTHLPSRRRAARRCSAAPARSLQCASNPGSAPRSASSSPPRSVCRPHPAARRGAVSSERIKVQTGGRRVRGGLGKLRPDSYPLDQAGTHPPPPNAYTVHSPSRTTT